MDSEDRYRDLARRIGDGDEIDWISEEGSVSDEEIQLVQRLRVVSEVGRVHREIHTSTRPERQEALPEAIGPYRIWRRLGAGGLGVVYEAERQEQRVALKVIGGARARDPEAVRLFEREAQTLSRLHHLSIAGIYEAGCTEEGEHFIAMELVRGCTLGEWRAGRSASPADSTAELRSRIALFREIGEAVAYAHKQRVIHRDLKPSNVLVLDDGTDGSSPPVKVLDFGLARAAFLSGITDPGRIKGTLPYMSPEQARGAPDEIDLRTDIYSLGIILYELLTDSRPYDLDQDSFRQKIDAILTARPRPLAETWRGSTPPDAGLEAVLHRALEKKSADRYPNVLALLQDLDQLPRKQASGEQEASS